MHALLVRLRAPCLAGGRQGHPGRGDRRPHHRRGPGRARLLRGARAGARGPSAAQRISVAALSHALSWYGLPARCGGRAGLAPGRAEPRGAHRSADPGVHRAALREALPGGAGRADRSTRPSPWSSPWGARLNEGNVPSSRTSAARRTRTSRGGRRLAAVTARRACSPSSPSHLAARRGPARLRPSRSSTRSRCRAPRTSSACCRACPRRAWWSPAFALYEQSRQAPAPRCATRSSAWRNNYLAYREQHDAVQPAFTPPGAPRRTRCPASELMQALTPVLLPGDGPRWCGSSPTTRAPSETGTATSLTSKATEYNWAVFSDRWPAILQAFELGYRSTAHVWKFPPPLVGPNGELTGQG